MSSSNIAPINVGIRGMELYFPYSYVDQRDLEKFDKVSSGRYTVGLGLEEMGFCGVEEDVTSVSLTVLSALLNNYQIDRGSVGYLIVGSETLTDKSKGVFTTLKRLFGDNDEIFGAECIGACYAGTSALFSAIDWIYANWSRERKYAIVVMADIAIYAPGPARCTGGVGAFAALIGPDAAVYFEEGLRCAVLKDVWDFYKPVYGVSTEYAHVNGQLSLESYLSMLDLAYEKYKKRASGLRGQETSLSSFQAVMMHCPFSKLVMKAFGRLAYADYLKGFHSHLVHPESLAILKTTSPEKSYTDRQFISATVAASKDLWQEKTYSNLFFNLRIGNMYTSSLYAQLFGLFHRSSIESLLGMKILFFSYGSGAAAAMFSATVNSSFSSEIQSQLENMKKSADLAAARLGNRRKVSPEVYAEILLAREAFIHGEKFSDVIMKNNSSLTAIGHFPGTYVIETVDDQMRRFYQVL